MSDSLRVILISGVPGALVLGISVRSIVHVWRLWRRGVRTSGVVVDNAKSDSDSGPKWEPVITFDDQHGHRVTSQPIIRIDKKVQVGQEVPVVYLAHKPKVMLIFSRRYLAMYLLNDWLALVVGSLFLGIAVAVAAGLVHVTPAG